MDVLLISPRKQVLSALKFSYDSLDSDKMRSAFLYCAVYPEDCDIRREKLVEYWAMEGLLDGGDPYDDDNIENARNRGHVLIGHLQACCLLEDGIEDPELTVRLHDAVRDMAIWLNRQRYEGVDGFLQAPFGQTKTTSAGRHPHVRRIWIREVQQGLKSSGSNIPSCPNARTLVLDSQRHLGAPLLRRCFYAMRALRVLELGHTNVDELPKEIGLLAELRYLNLSATRIRSLPKEMGDLINLRELVLKETRRLCCIPRKTIVGLSGLQVLNMWCSGYDWEDANRRATFSGAERQAKLGDLERLGRLQELHIDLGDYCGLLRILRSDALCGCIRGIRLSRRNGDRGDDLPLYGDGGALLRFAVAKIGSQLRDLDLWEDKAHPWAGKLQLCLDQLPRLRRLFLRAINSEQTSTVVLAGGSAGKGGGIRDDIVPPSLCSLHIYDCRRLKKLELVGRFPCLELINMDGCWGLEELMLGGDFPVLKRIYLVGLRALGSLGRRHLLLPSLETIMVIDCPQMRRFSLGSVGGGGGGTKLCEVYGEQEWWDDLGWEDGDGRDVKARFMSLFHPRRRASFDD